MFPTYSLDKSLRLMPTAETPVVNFSQLKELLLCKDLKRNNELDWASKQFRFLDAKEDLALTGERICFLSFMRTGNTMTRNFLETITGVYTGSDMNLILTQEL